MTKPIIGISIGDINGVGAETIIKLFSDERLYKYCKPVVYGSTQVLSYYKKLLENKSFKYAKFKAWNELTEKHTTVINCIDENAVVEPGEEREEAGAYALKCIDEALKDWKSGKIDGLITAPINKNTVAKAAEGSFSGHTEYITSFCESEESLMLLASDLIRVGLVTNHLPLQDVSSKITVDLIVEKIALMENSLKRDFNIQQPRIAVLSLNPHAGDKGLIGAEEQDIIIPAITQCFRNGTYVFGPFPTDGFFGSSDFKKFDGILAMYHDQGLTPFKALVFDEGVNFTAGLPLVRTSPDHGTAYAIAGKNEASEMSLRQALFMCLDIIKNRSEHDVLKENALKKKEKFKSR